MRTAAGRADDHDAVPYEVRFVQLNALVKPWSVRLQAPRLRHLPNSRGSLAKSVVDSMVYGIVLLTLSGCLACAQRHPDVGIDDLRALHAETQKSRTPFVCL